MRQLKAIKAAQWWLDVARQAVDSWRFSGARGDYYDYLSALLAGMQGRRPLRDVFELDARRYGPGAVRGRLSERWVRTYQAAGGDLYATWYGCFPPSELLLIRVAQSFGNAALIQTLGELAQVHRLTSQAGQLVVSTLWSAAAALIVLFSMLLAVPVFTVPRLLLTFSAVPEEYYGALTRSLLAFATLVHEQWAFAASAGAGGCWLLLWSLPNTTGRLRGVLDRFSIWRIYRQVQALRFLALLAIVLGRDEAMSTQLRTALAMQSGGASVWQAGHINAMLARIDSGIVGADTFNTGLLDREQYWFLSDMVMARGLGAGMSLTGNRLRSHVLGTVARQATGLRWSLLLASVACLLSLALWHYAVIDELRRSLLLFYASQ
ncbi:MAG TPA: hypothetical protein VL001_00140 [Candidimonas sp.]|nr:hypothetical protein [Candidimonas sp.]